MKIEKDKPLGVLEIEEVNDIFETNLSAAVPFEGNIDAKDGSKPTANNVTVSSTGAYFGKGTTNLVVDGCFENGVHAQDISGGWSQSKDHPASMNGSLGYNIVNKENPLSSVSNLVLEATDRGEYEMTLPALEPDTDYVMSCWVSYDHTYNGSDQVFHARAYCTDGTSKQSAGAGYLVDKVTIGGRVWEKRYLSFRTNNVAGSYTAWYLGYVGTSAENMNGSNRYFTGIMLHKGTKPVGYVNGTTTDSAYNLGDPTGIINKSEHSVMMEVMSDGGGFGTAEDWAMAFSLSDAFYLGWNNKTSMTVSLVNGDTTTQNYLTVSGLNFEHHKRYLVGYTFNNGDLAIYVDGKVIGTKNIGSTTVAYSDSQRDVVGLFVGTFYNRGSYCNHGWVKNLKIYNKALSEDDFASASARVNSKSGVLYTNSISDYIYDTSDAILNFPLDSLESLDKGTSIPSTAVLSTDKFTGIKTLRVGGNLLPVYVDRGWVRVFNHNSDHNANLFANTAEAKLCNTSDPNNVKYSILNHLEQFRCRDGKFTFKLRYPDEVGEAEKYTNIWRQSSNPTHQAVADYEPIRIGYNGNSWGGLEYNGSPTLCDGSVNNGNWYHSVGQISSYSSGNPGCGKIVQLTELWVQCDHLNNLIFDEEGCWVGTAYENIVFNPTNKPSTKILESEHSWDWAKHADSWNMTGWSDGYNSGVTNESTVQHAKWTFNAGYKDPRTCSGEYVEDGSGSWLGLSQGMRHGAYINHPDGIVVGDKMNISAYHKSNRVGSNNNIRAGHIGNYHKRISDNGNTFGTTTHTLWNSVVDVWERTSGSYEIDSDWDLTQHNTLYSYGHSGSYVGTSYVTNYQVTKGEFQRPFIDGKNGASSLTIDITDLTRKTWNDDWTIAYWKKPMGTSNDAMDGNSFDRVNKAGATYFIGKSITGDKYISSHAGAISGYTNFDGNYFGKWQLMIISKSGANLTTRCAYPLPHTFTTTVSTVGESIIFNTGNGDNESHTNAYYKDFLFFDRTLTEDEITMLYGRKAKITKDGLSTLNGVIEI